MLPEPISSILFHGNRAAEPTITLHDVLKRHADLRVDVDVQDRGVVRDVDRPADIGA